MHPEKYTLTWYSHTDSLKEIMRNMMTSETLGEKNLVEKKHGLKWVKMA